MKSRVMAVVFPHPDDEVMMTGGLLLEVKKQGWKTVVICLTQGGAGKNHLKNTEEKTLKEIRRDELVQAVKILGVDRLILADFEDSKLRYTGNKWQPWLSRQVSELNPDRLVTYDPSGFYGHPDHIAVSKFLLCEFGKKIEIYFSAVPYPVRKVMIDRIRGFKEALDLMVEPTLKIDLKGNIFKKWKAAKMHKSQNLGKSMKLSLFLFLVRYHFEWYHKVDPERKYTYRYTDYRI